MRSRRWLRCLLSPRSAPARECWPRSSSPTRTPSAPAVQALRRLGVLTRGLVGGALQISPPLVLTDDEVAELATALATALG